MRAANPMVETVRCSAHNRQGKQCSKPAIPGGTVCRFHGGGAPQVREAAQLRILGMVSPALARLRKLIDGADSDSVKLHAVKDVLDRAGLGAAMQIQHTGKDGSPLFDAAALRDWIKSTDENGE